MHEDITSPCLTYVSTVLQYKIIMALTSRPSASVYPIYCNNTKVNCRPSSPVSINRATEVNDTPLSINAPFKNFQYIQKETRTVAFKKVSVARM